MKKHHAYQMDDDLLMRYLTGGDLSGQESDTVRKFLEADPENREYLEQMEKIWKSSGSIKDFQSVDTAKDWISLRAKFESSQQTGRNALWEQSRNLSYRIIRIAAIFLLVFASAFMLYYYTGNAPLSRMDWVSVNVRDRQEEVSLPDGTRVFLNVHSSLVYPDEFRGRKRSVKLDGEAFFEVARDEKPFVVNIADEVSVEVLGTSFNLRTDPKNKKVFLSVLTGKVAIYPKDKKKQARVLKQDEHAVYDNGKIKSVRTPDLNFLSWKTRTLRFENTPLADVVEQLGRYYRMEFRIQDQELDSLALTGTYQNQTMEDVLEEIELVLDIVFQEVNGTVQVTSSEKSINAD